VPVCRQKIGADGKYSFYAPMGSDETVLWSRQGDPKPHVHYDLICNRCANAPASFTGASFRYWLKFWPKELCLLSQCGAGAETPNEDNHKATKTTVDGTVTYSYDIVVPFRAT
jgi:hypothetical protein